MMKMKAHRRDSRHIHAYSCSDQCTQSTFLILHSFTLRAGVGFRCEQQVSSPSLSHVKGPIEIK
jgi:hypothetical protein